MRILVMWVLSCVLSCAYAEDLMTSQLADQARQWQEKGRDDLAADLWRKILRADPKHAEARAKLLQIEAPKTSEAPKPPTQPPISTTTPGATSAKEKNTNAAVVTKPKVATPTASGPKASSSDKASVEKKIEVARPVAARVGSKPAITKDAPVDKSSAKNPKPEIVKGRT
ncbi:MAG: hypothetical protein K2X65_00010, partial [Burkholderiaceae bacterium]|nr:hypothetical protein [Burkholderiaceae bacterium]